MSRPEDHRCRWCRHWSVIPSLKTEHENRCPANPKENTMPVTVATAYVAPVDADEPELLTPGEVARIFRVDPKTVTRWAKAGKLDAVRTLGGHRRYRADEVDALLRGR